MTVDLNTLRKGDKILIPATVTGRRVAQSVVVQLPSQNEVLVYRDNDVEKITHYDVHAGDCVKWNGHCGHNPGWGVITHIDEGVAWIRLYNDKSKRVTVAVPFLTRQELPEGFGDKEAQQ